MDLLLNLSKVLVGSDNPDDNSGFKLFKTCKKIFDKYNDKYSHGVQNVNEGLESSNKSRYPELYEFLESYNDENDYADISIEIANIIYNQRGSYRAIDMLSEILGIPIELRDADNNLLNSPGADKTPVHIVKVVYDELSIHQYFAIRSKFIAVIKELVWYLDPNADIDVVEVIADMSIVQSGEVFGGEYLIHNIVINEVEDET